MKSMSIYKPALERINSCGLSGPSCANLFETIAQKMREGGAACAEFKLGYVDKDTPPDELPKQGEYVPEIIFRLTS